MPRLPKRFAEFMQQYPDVGRAYRALGDATEAAGPLSAREIRLAKLAIAVGTRQESAVRAHARRALEAGCSPDEIRHILLLSTTTIGFSAMMTALGWVENMIAERAPHPDAPQPDASHPDAPQSEITDTNAPDTAPQRADSDASNDASSDTAPTS